MKLPINHSGEHKTERLVGMAPRFAESKRKTTEFVRITKGESASFEIDQNGFITVWPQSAERVFGYEPAEAIGKHIAQIYCEDDLKHGRAVYELLAASTRGSYATAGWQRRKNGQVFWVQSESTKITSGFLITMIERAAKTSCEDEI